jgi:NAD(P)-dependent dehydrogenase (short-subunit alcohol dehydrogenase family)
MIIDLTGRKVIVTGSTADIGRATAERLVRAGAAVVVNGSTNARVEVQCGRFGKYCPMPTLPALPQTWRRPKAWRR